MPETIAEITIPEFNEYVVLSNKRRTKKDSSGKILNPKSAGTPRLWKINGQDLYSGNMHPMMRKKAAGWAHSYLRPYLKSIPKITLLEGQFLSIQLTIYDVIVKANWDVSNKWPWIKWFEDTLVELGKIPDDCILYVRDSGRIIFHPVNTPEEKKLVFNIKKYSES